MLERVRSLKIYIFLLLPLVIVIALHGIEYKNYKDLPKIKLNNKTVYLRIEHYPDEVTPYATKKSILRRPLGVLRVFSYDEENPIIESREMESAADILWIDKNGRIVDITINIEPCSTEPCKRFASKQKVKYLLYLPAFWTKINEISANNQIDNFPLNMGIK